MLCGMQEKLVNEGYDRGMLGRLALPCLNDHLVVAEEPYAFSAPEVSPGEGGNHDGEEFLPLDGYVLREQLVWLPRVVEPSAAEVCPTAQSTGGVSVQVQVASQDATRVDEVGSAIPGGKEVDPPGKVSPGLPRRMR